MKISTVIPTYQGARFLEEMLQSVQNQSRRPDELIISDDASTDNTCQIVEEFACGSPFPVHLLRHGPSGITENYLNGIRRATGDVIVVGDQDDIWVSNRIEEIESLFVRSSDIALVSCDSLLVDEKACDHGTTIRGGARKSSRLSSRINRGDDFLEFLKGNLWLLAHTLSFRSAIQSALINKPKNISGWWFEDWAACIGVCSGRLALIPEALTLYRQHANQASKKSATATISLKQGATSKYSDRIQRMEFCLSLMSASRLEKCFDNLESERRMKILREYLGFLERRDTLLQSTMPSGVLAAVNLLIAGEYRRFSRGILSFWSDMICLLTRRP
jgi:glycosyltransferase involved in cell wall biosynthesis